MALGVATEELDHITTNIKQKHCSLINNCFQVEVMMMKRSVMMMSDDDDKVNNEDGHLNRCSTQHGSSNMFILRLLMVYI